MSAAAELKSTASEAGRWIRSQNAVILLALLGVPVCVVMLTGGPSTIGFWLEVLFKIGIAYTFGPMALGALLLIPIVLLFGLLSKLAPRWEDRIATVLSYFGIVVGGTAAFVFGADLEPAGTVLPTSNPNVGALIVVSTAVGAMMLLFKVASYLPAWERRGRKPVAEAPESSVRPSPVPEPPKSPLRPAPVPEPDEEFWSPEPIVAWRAWRWNGTTLHGVVVAWPESELEAKCATCHEPPGWEHTCGIYAVHDQSGLALLRASGGNVVGKVELSGLVVEHESGYRAKHVRILELWVPSMAISQQVKEAYPDVEVQVGRPQIEGEE